MTYDQKAVDAIEAARNYILGANLDRFRSAVVAAALADVARGVVEDQDAEQDAWINENIIRPVLGDAYDEDNAEYCACAVSRWWRLGGWDGEPVPASTGKILYRWGSNGNRLIHDTARNVGAPMLADIVLHQSQAHAWHGHVMLCLAYDADTGRVLVAEGNHSKSIGPTGEKYTDATYGEDIGRRAGIGVRWLRWGDPYIDWIVRRVK